MRLALALRDTRNSTPHELTCACELRYARDELEVRGLAIEFRVVAEKIVVIKRKAAP